MLSMFKSKLFNNKIEPSCRYCSYGDLSFDKVSVLCEKKGVVDPDSPCRSFDYSPLKRMPKKPRKLPEYNPEEFDL